MAWTDLLLPMDDCDFFVRIVPFPHGPIHAATVTNPDGTHSVYIDANVPEEKQKAEYWHEYEHLAFNDFDNGKSIQEIEKI